MTPPCSAIENRNQEINAVGAERLSLTC
ncbi:hypothetical protein Patl1_01477 [Pistacia atlantica]|uniref:Uncharacterized protein n=1 Tax=Pistacia atlantica TaxID=434234 RepID=A0ACC1CCU7_9ROSI|nr:hypothetical protein Patl1_01477 [Pistacia atlantica]